MNINKSNLLCVGWTWSNFPCWEWTCTRATIDPCIYLTFDEFMSIFTNILVKLLVCVLFFVNFNKCNFLSEKYFSKVSNHWFHYFCWTFSLTFSAFQSSAQPHNKPYSHPSCTQHTVPEEIGCFWLLKANLHCEWKRPDCKRGDGQELKIKDWHIIDNEKQTLIQITKNQVRELNVMSIMST